VTVATRASSEKHLAALERQVADIVRQHRLEPAGEWAWTAWMTCDELEELERIYHAAAYEDVEPSVAERRRIVEITSRCTLEMFAGEPTDDERERLEREAMRERTGWPR
jgi:hypothetical protein